MSNQFTNKKPSISYIEHENYIEGVLKKGDSFYIDKEDYVKIKDYYWHKSTGYLRNTKLGLMHRYITEVDATKEIDHLDRNRMNNRKCNLKICDRMENMKNKSTYKNNTSGHKGIKWNERLQKWQVQITVNKQRIHLGVFKELQDAIVERRKAEIEHFKK